MKIKLSKDERTYISMLMQLDERSTRPVYQYSQSINIDESGWCDLFVKINRVM